MSRSSLCLIIFNLATYWSDVTLFLKILLCSCLQGVHKPRHTKTKHGRPWITKFVLWDCDHHNFGGKCASSLLKIFLVFVSYLAFYCMAIFYIEWNFRKWHSGKNKDFFKTYGCQNNSEKNYGKKTFRIDFGGNELSENWKHRAALLTLFGILMTPSRKRLAQIYL